MNAPDEQQLLLRSHFARSTGCLRKQYKVLTAFLNVLLICLLTWVIITGAFFILIRILEIPVFGIDPNAAGMWNSYPIALVVHIAFVLLAVGGYALWVLIAMNLKPPVELRLAFTDAFLAEEWLAFLRKTIALVVFAYILSPQITQLLLRIAIYIAWLLKDREVHVSWLLMPIDFIAIEILLIDLAVAIAVCLKDKLLQFMAWSAVAVITYGLWWAFRKLWQYALVYMVNTLEWTYLTNGMAFVVSILLIIFVLRGKAELAAYSLRCARSAIADEGCS